MARQNRQGLAKTITAAFYNANVLKIQRPNAPRAGLEGLPEVRIANQLREHGASPTEIRLFLTFIAAMDRARDADSLWNAAGRMFQCARWIFDPSEVVGSTKTKLRQTLESYQVSQRHKKDAESWHRIAELLSGASTPRIHDAIYKGVGVTQKLIREVDQFPLLRGPKIHVMWLRMLVYPGYADISDIQSIPVAVDVQVRKVTEYLGVTATSGQKLDTCRDLIQGAWTHDVMQYGAEGPPALVNTCAALDPALWFVAKWGCTYCEQQGHRIPIASFCADCRFDELCPEGKTPIRNEKCEQNSKRRP